MDELPVDLLSADNPYETRDRFFKLIIGTVVGFAAQRMADGAYEKFIIERRLNRL